MKLLQAIQNKFPDVTRIEFNLRNGISAAKMCTAYTKEGPKYVLKPGGPLEIIEDWDEEWMRNYLEMTTKLNEAAQNDPFLPILVMPIDYLKTASGKEYEIMNHIAGGSLLDLEEEGKFEIIENYGKVLAHLIMLAEGPVTADTEIYAHDDSGLSNIMYHEGRYYYIDCLLLTYPIRIVLEELFHCAWGNHVSGVFRTLLEELPASLRPVVEEIISSSISENNS